MSVIRKIAAEIVHDALFGDVDVEATVEAVLNRIRPAGKELSFFRELAVGSVRMAGTLDAIIGACSKAGLSGIEPRVLAALRVGAYELVFMEEASPCAAIDAMARTALFWSPRAGESVREILGLISESAGQLARKKPGKADGRFVLQVGHSLWRVFNRPVFPDPRKQRIEYVSAVCSLPLWLTRRLAGQHGDSLENIAAALNSPPRNVIFANTLQNKGPQLAGILAKQGIAAEPGKADGALLPRENLGVESVPAYMHGRFCVADEFDIDSADYLRARSGERICILRGRVQTMARIALACAPEGRVTVCAAGAAEAKSIALEAARLGLPNVSVVVLDAGEAACVLDASFDRVFVEAGSSGTGRLKRSAAARWRVKEEMLTSLTHEQKRLLSAAIELCAAGGIAVYVTGSLLREENEDVVASVVGSLPHLKVADRSTLPPRAGGPEGGFRARIVKFSAF
jgi:16S rRNA (cytosine967-C5)-methyltransferase